MCCKTCNLRDNLFAFWELIGGGTCVMSRVLYVKLLKNIYR